jgi:hypothetical protein
MPIEHKPNQVNVGGDVARILDVGNQPTGLPKALGGLGETLNNLLGGDQTRKGAIQVLNRYYRTEGIAPYPIIIY